MPRSQDISGADVIQKLDSLAEDARNLSSVLVNTPDPVKIGLAILSNTNDLVVAIPDIFSLEGLGHFLFDDMPDERQLEICATYLKVSSTRAMGIGAQN
ncbi:hypothetical protein BDV27DRAFT_127332 [Aspergillus caelatus]|uniref:Uncharacterized protein n=1 Tax=Aspergillus caelatus TaxID=61420 RepID=A0A5N7A978_9EURO|nr:uncharacterized protein BDV27DRAFT_127332 [Aspergillus caelatus]KAE8365140.1 hypothetical protein BDV27DRAFT_127332 [Aspergillus caelatus]